MRIILVALEKKFKFWNDFSWSFIWFPGQQKIMELRKPKEEELNSGRALFTDLKETNLSLRYLLKYLFRNLGKYMQNMIP